MYCVKSSQTIEEVIKKSRFIGIIIPCDTENKFLFLTHLILSHFIMLSLAYTCFQKC